MGIPDKNMPIMNIYGCKNVSDIFMGDYKSTGTEIKTFLWINLVGNIFLSTLTHDLEVSTLPLVKSWVMSIVSLLE